MSPPSGAWLVQLAGVCLVTANAAWAEEPASVSGLVVTAHRPRVEKLIDRTVYDVKTDVQSATGTAADVLQHIPSVEVDADGAVSLRGDPSVTILIDGRPAAQFAAGGAGSGLLSLSASDIERVEVMTSPPAQYKVEGSGGVINIITRRKRTSGLTGTLQANAGDNGRYSGAANLSYAAGKLSLTGGLLVRKDFRRRIIADQRTTTDPASGAQTTSQESLNEGLRRTTLQARAGADYDLSPDLRLGGAFSHQEVQGGRNFLQTDASFAPSGSTTAASSRVSQGFAWNQNTSAEAHLDRTLPNSAGVLTLTGRRTTSRERERYRLDDQFQTPPKAPDAQHLHLMQNRVVTEASAEFSRDWNKDRNLRVGYDFEDDRYEFHNFGDTVDLNSGATTPNPLVTFDFVYRQRIHTGYLVYGGHLGAWRAKLGVRAEDTQTTTNLDVGGVSSTHRYFRAYPSLHAETALSPSDTFSFSLARRVNRPDPGALNPFVDYQDIYNLRAGDADLRPEDVWSYEAGWRHERPGRTLSVTGFYRFSRDGVTDLVKPLSGNVVLLTKTNLAKAKSGGVEVVASGRVLPRLTYNVSGTLAYSQIGTATLEASALRSTLALNAKASLEWRPSAQDTLQAAFSRTGRRLTPQGEIGAIGLVNFGYRREMSRRFTLVATLSDAFDGQNLRRTIATPTLEDAYDRRQLGQVAYLGFQYSFGGPKKAKPAEFQYDP